MFRFLFRAAIAAIVLSSSTLAFAQDGHMPGPTVTIGTLELHDGFARATLPNAPVGGVFFAVTNTGTVDDQLVSVAAPDLGDAQLHTMSMDGDVMKMQALPEGIAIPAGQTVTLEPSGLHVMVMGLKAPFVEGQTVKVTLTFAVAGSVDLELPVLGVAADSAMPMHH
ncbi:MAG TPA: copper chaperone PCu(A)C [Devosia sp.]|nr:copper chaperone PCu(A)C [Devosia sp.]